MGVVGVVVGGTFTHSPALSELSHPGLQPGACYPSASTFFLLPSPPPHHSALCLQLKSLHQHLGPALAAVHSRPKPPLVAWSLVSPRYLLLLARLSNKSAVATTPSLCCYQQQHGRQ